MMRWFSLAIVVLAFFSAGCGGGGEEPSEIPKSPPKGQGLPR